MLAIAGADFEISHVVGQQHVTMLGSVVQMVWIVTMTHTHVTGRDDSMPCCFQKGNKQVIVGTVIKVDGE